MTHFFVAAAMAFAATMIFAFQFSYWDSRKLLAAVFCLIFTADMVAASFLPAGLLHPAIGVVCLGMGGAILLAHAVIEKVRRAEEKPEYRD
ncbi:MAG: hypothetical protein ACI8W8_000777 [Rhodothermales bacterium]|jgi:hypothetical protein